MKNTHGLSLLLVASTTVNAMENNQNQLTMVEVKSFHQMLRNGYKNIVIEQLKEYKKSDSIDMNQLIHIGKLIMQSSDIVPQLLHWDIKDEDQNCFIHLAAKKADVALAAWLFMQGDKNYVYVNADQEYPLDICIKKLLPNAIDVGLRSRKLFDLMVPYIAKQPAEYDDFKMLCLKKIIALQFKHKRNKSNFIVDNQLLQSLVPQTLLIEQPSILSTMYRETIDETDGSTLSHILVEQENPDELYDLAKTDQIVWTKNKLGQTSIELAFARFRDAIKEIALVTADDEAIAKRGCCLFILLHHARNQEIKNGAIDVVDLGNCCDKHVL